MHIHIRIVNSKFGTFYPDGETEGCEEVGRHWTLSQRENIRQILHEVAEFIPDPRAPLPNEVIEPLCKLTTILESII